jgi:hypothetical protein
MKTVRSLLVVGALAVSATFALAPEASARGYTCRYAGIGVTAVLDGSENSALRCRSFNSKFKGARVATTRGRLYCTFQMRIRDVRLKVWSQNQLQGRLYCGLLSKQHRKSGDWVRTR